MAEKAPPPISRGIEIQKTKIEEIQSQALERYKGLTVLDNIIGARLDAALSLPPGQEELMELAKLFEQKHVLEEIGRELEGIILRSFERQDTLLDRWMVLEKKLLDAESLASIRNE